MQLSEEILKQHYAHLVDRPYFKRIQDSMMISPVIVCCWKGLDAVQVVRAMTGPTNGRQAPPGTIRGDYSMSVQENIVHASDSTETAAIELARFFDDDEIFEFTQHTLDFLYANDEI